MNAAAILAAIAEILKEWRRFIVSRWRKEGQDVVSKIESAKTKEEIESATDDLLDHINNRPE